MQRPGRLNRLFILASFLTISLAAFGCSRQQEGERCVLLNGDRDCDNGANPELFCTAASTLRGREDGVDRCCPNPDEEPNDSRCALRTTGTPGLGGATGDGDGDGDGDSDGSTGGAAGKTCVYNSDCPDDLACLLGSCQSECKEDRDCAAGSVCNKDQVCVLES